MLKATTAAAVNRDCRIILLKCRLFQIITMDDKFKDGLISAEIWTIFQINIKFDSADNALDPDNDYDHDYETIKVSKMRICNSEFTADKAFCYWE